MLLEIIFIALEINTIYSNVFSGFKTKITFKVTTIANDVVVILLRITLLLNKARILRALSKLYSFRNGQQKVNHSPLRKYAILACAVCLLFPLALVIGCVSFALLKMDKYISSVKLINQNSSNSRVEYALFITGHTVLYMNHTLIFPGLVTVLLSFTYLSFIKTFQTHLDEMRCKLLRNLSRREISRALIVFTIAKEIHQDIEKAMSFVSFLVYVLSFGKIISVISIIVTDILPNEESMKIMHSYFIPIWTMMWFILLTMCGTQAKKSEAFIKNMNQEVATKNFVKKGEEQKDLNILNSCSKIELRFTGWGMFVVDKTLFLSTAGVLVTYGVLYASEVSKIPD
ncbi:uncharacterized protein TNCT_410931 [Trichonephila clavata]|uniref:Gustatory receptor n=1 Tax=Trichonephila clavata TaxID=2740835 RepID=A0A8X6HFP4_TRICU|nr:uncharacterized protein TNCT_410931 [Trichonephila clavata]